MKYSSDTHQLFRYEKSFYQQVRVSNYIYKSVSCDEAYLEFPVGTCGVEIAKRIRHDIFEVTKCTASVGVAHNMLLARYF